MTYYLFARWSLVRPLCDELMLLWPAGKSLSHNGRVFSWNFPYIAVSDYLRDAYRFDQHVWILIRNMWLHKICFGWWWVVNITHSLCLKFLAYSLETSMIFTVRKSWKSMYNMKYFPVWITEIKKKKGRTNDRTLVFRWTWVGGISCWLGFKTCQ